MAPESPPRATGSRSSNACENCRRRKVKCNRIETGDQPCRSCSRNGLECAFGDAGRRGYPKSYVQVLLARIKEKDKLIRDLSAGQASPAASHSPAGPAGAANRGPEPNAQDKEDEAHSEASPMSEDMDTAPASELASGPAFESRIRSLLKNHTDSTTSSPTLNEALPLLSTDLGPISPWRTATDLVDGISPPVFLSKAESHRLLDLFLSLLGVNQHFLDPRAFADNLSLLYNERTRTRQMQTAWYTQYLLVMSIGMLIGSSSPNLKDPPGIAYFAEAMRRLPQLYRVVPVGITTVEVLCLTALYFQWCDRKHTAYLYIGSAARLALALGCAQPYNEQQGVPSELCHRVRVWWTVYMLDRRLSAALGLPMAVDDRQLRAELPRGGAGFRSPVPLSINVQIARATGDIMTSFYGNQTISQLDLVRKIQSTLQNLYGIGTSIPATYALDFSDEQMVVSRTSASLYLMLFQAIILCIRPVILQIVKDKVQRAAENQPPQTIPPVIARLCHSCQEAATKCISILTSIRKQGTIALFGFFDLDATFSAAFILVMMGFINIKESAFHKAPEGIQQAAEVLQYLSRAGNQAAEQRLNDLKQFCSHVWSPEKRSQEWKWLDSPVPTPASQNVAETNLGEGDATAAETRQAARESAMLVEGWETGPNQLAIVSSSNDQETPAFTFPLGENFDIDLTGEADGIYSSFYDPNLPLTGVDQGDWAEMGKIFFPQ